MIDYSKNIFLTFDIDWSPDFVVQHLVDILEKHNVSGTFFCTHHNKFFDRLKNHSLIELGLHPNYNFLLDLKSDITAKKIVFKLSSYYPEAVSIRSHSLFQNSALFFLYKQLGLKIDSNIFIPEWSGLELKAYREVNGMVRAPYFWEDDVHALAIENGVEKNWKTKKYLKNKGLKIFDFHPIHVYLNTENLKRYDSSKHFLQQKAKLDQFVNKKSDGCGIFLENLIFEWKCKNGKFQKLKKLITI